MSYPHNNIHNHQYQQPGTLDSSRVLTTVPSNDKQNVEQAPVQSNYPTFVPNPAFAHHHPQAPNYPPAFNAPQAHQGNPFSGPPAQGAHPQQQWYQHALYPIYPHQPQLIRQNGPIPQELPPRDMYPLTEISCEDKHSKNVTCKFCGERITTTVESKIKVLYFILILFLLGPLILGCLWLAGKISYHRHKCSNCHGVLSTKGEPNCFCIKNRKPKPVQPETELERAAHQ